MNIETLIADMQRPEAYPHAVDEVGFLQTHISLLFFAGERVYKIKKTVDLGFLDYTSLEARWHFCEEEVRLNRRLAPDTYLGVVPLGLGEDGHVRLGGDGAPVEWAVAMRRLPEERMLNTLLDRGSIDNAELNAIGTLLARFHRQAPTGEGIDEYGSPAAIKANFEENFDQLKAFVQAKDEPESGVLSPELFEHLHAAGRAFLAVNEGLLLARVQEHAIREGHGDLHAGNICLLEEGIVIYDCIEFNQRFRCGDVAADLAFLAMDLDKRGYRGFSRYLVKRYGEWAEDAGLDALMGFYKGYRALVRAKVEAISAEAPALEAQEREAHRRTSMGYVHLALSYELPPALYLMCGLPASGKSWLAKGLSQALGAALLQSDRRRKRLAGLPPGASASAEYGSGLYSQELKHATYDSLLEGALERMEKHRPVIVDATFSERSFRAPFVQAAKRLGLPLVLLHVHASEALTRERMQQRAEDPHALSDANFEVYLAAKARFEAPDELDESQRIQLSSTERCMEDAVGEALTQVTRRLGAT